MLRAVERQSSVVLDFYLDEVRKIGRSMSLTESLAMTPASSVSGFYIGHPEATYFNVGTIGPDQLSDWAQRNAMDKLSAERALAPLLG